MIVSDIYHGSDGESTKALYARLETLGPIGIVALNLFRAQKCSERAKGYRRRAHKGEAYERKNWSMGLLCTALMSHAQTLSVRWGWKEDAAQEIYKWVLYVDLPITAERKVQISFHAGMRGAGPDYGGEWDGQIDVCANRVIDFVDSILNPRPITVAQASEPAVSQVSKPARQIGLL